MSKLWIILKREYLQVVRKKSFILGVLLMPLLMGAFMLLPAWLATKESTSSEHLAVVDQSARGIGTKFAESLSRYQLENTDQPYYVVDTVIEIDSTDHDAFLQQIDSLRNQIIEKELKYFLVIRADAHLVDSNLYLVTNSDNFISLRRFERRLSNVLSTIRLQETNVNIEVDSILAITRRIDLATRDAKGESMPFEVKYFAGLFFSLLLFGMIFGYGQLVMRSVIEEKNSRIMEVLISSVSPFQLMMGKVLGLGAATFTQVGIWFAMGGIIYTQTAALNISSSIDRIIFNPVIPVFFILFLISGFIMFSSIFAIIGSIVNSEKEAQSFIFPITMTMMIPVMIGIHVVQEPNSTLAVSLSMIPLLAPTMMMMRLVFIVPTMSEYSIFSGIVGEATLSLILVVVTSLMLVWLASRIFRVGILMYGKRPTLREVLKWIRQ